jgi:WD40 repeat protein/Tfp pilus assembly protein PilF
MTERTHVRDATLSLSAERRVNAVCNRFELSWQAGRRPRIEDCLGDVPAPERAALLRELVALEIDCRQRAGECPTEDEYRDRFPDLALAPLLADRATKTPNASPGTEVSLPTVPGYECLKKLGRGGMGVVYWAWQHSLNRPVALKMILAGAHSGPRELARFQVEAEAVARLHHPHIVQVYEVGAVETCPYLVLEYVDGGSLAQQLNGTPLPARQAARLMELLARAMHEAHGKGVVHRDLTPANVLMARSDSANGIPLSSPEGEQYYQPKITDFGLAKLLVGGGPALTGSGDILGTPSYMAPEQARGQTKAIGPATDTYALGALLYELLTGRPPFMAATMVETLLQVQTEEPVTPSRLQPKLPRDLTTICLKCLEKLPGKRYASADDLAEDLKRFLEDRSIKARPASAPEKLWRLCRRNPATAGLVAAAVVLISVLSVGVPLGLLLRAERNVAFQAEIEALNAKDRAEAAEKETKIREYLGKAQAFRWSGQPGQRFKCLAEIQAALQLQPSPEMRQEMRNEAIAALCLPDLEVAKEWDGSPKGWLAFCVDAAFERYARSDKDGNIRICRIEDDRELLVLPGGIGPYSGYEGLLFSPDGRFLRCSTQHHRSRLWKLDRKEPTVVIDDGHLGFAFSPDSRQLAAGYPDGTVRLFDTASGKESRRFRADLGGAPVTIRWHPSRPHLAICARTSWRILDLETGELEPLVDVREGIAGSTWHPEGRLFATSGEWPVGGVRRIILWNALTRGRALPPLEGPRNAGGVVCFNHAGDRLVNTDWENLWRVWDWRTGRQLLSLPAYGGSFQFSPDDSLLAAEVGLKVRLFRFRSGAEFRTLPRSGAARGVGFLSVFPGQFCLHPNGRLLAAGALDAIVLIDLQRLEEIGLLPLPNNHPLCFEPAGNALLAVGQDGVIHWNLQGVETTSDTIRIGSPEILDPQGYTAGSSGSSADGKVIACPTGDGARILRRTADGRIQFGSVRPQQDVRNSAVSPDGRWVATGTHTLTEGGGAKVWEAKIGKHVADLPVAGLCSPWFSPDGRWLVTNTFEGSRIWKVGTWDEGPTLGGRMQSHSCALSPDGRLLALDEGACVVRLVHPETGVEVARLTAPEKTRLLPWGFTPDGGTLLTCGLESRDLHVFDLRAIRAGLRELGLDWDDEPLPAARPRPDKPLHVEGDLGRVEARRQYNQGNEHLGKKEYTKAAEIYRQAIKSDPEYAPALNNLAWLLLTAPPPVRDAKEALSLARRAVALEGSSPSSLNTLGVALYRNEQYAEAIDFLEKSLQQSKGATDAFDLYFLAMCHAKQGDTRKAEACFDRAVRWVQARKGKLFKGWPEELKQFRVEAEAVLGKATSPDVEGLYDQDAHKLTTKPGYWINRVAFTPVGKQVVATGGGVFVYDLETRKLLQRVLERQFARRALALSKDGKYFLTGHEHDKLVHLGEVASGKVVRAFEGHTAPGVHGVAFSPDETVIASGGDDGTLRIWDLLTSNELRRCEGMTDRIFSLAFSPDGKTIASGHYGTNSTFLVRLWETATGKEVRSLTGYEQVVTAVKFLPEGDKLLSSSLDGTLRLWDVATGKELMKMTHAGGARDVAVSPDGQRALSAGSGDKTVRLWDLTTGRELTHFEGHTSSVLGVAFSADGKRALSSDTDDTVRLWRLEK